MAYDLETSNDAFILKLSGNVDLSETSDIKDIIRNEPKAGFKKLQVECEQTEYMDSSAVALLLFAKRIAEENHMIFEIKSISSAAKKIIELAGLAQVFSLPSVEGNSNDSETAADLEDKDNIQDAEKVEINLGDSETSDTSATPEEAADTQEPEVEMNFEAEEEAADTQEPEVEMNFEAEEEVKEANKVDKVEKSGENSDKSKDSGSSGSDDFEFKPGTFE